MNKLAAIGLAAVVGSTPASAMPGSASKSGLYNHQPETSGGLFGNQSPTPPSQLLEGCLNERNTVAEGFKTASYIILDQEGDIARRDHYACNGREIRELYNISGLEGVTGTRATFRFQEYPSIVWIDGDIWLNTPDNGLIDGDEQYYSPEATSPTQPLPQLQEDPSVQPTGQEYLYWQTT